MFTPADVLRSLKKGGPAGSGGRSATSGGAGLEWLQATFRKRPPSRPPAMSKASGQPKSGLGCVTFMERHPPMGAGQNKQNEAGKRRREHSPLDRRRAPLASALSRQAFSFRISLPTR